VTLINRLAYLAPEIPSLSATFVYNEIFQLQAMGIEVEAFSVHESGYGADDIQIQQLTEKTFNLYCQPKLSVLMDNIMQLIHFPSRYLKTLSLLIKDIRYIGFSRTSVGLVYRMFFSAGLARQLQQKECQHLHVHFAHVPTDIAMYAASLSGITFSVTAHANDLYERGWLLKQKVERSSFFATISDFNKQFLKSEGIPLDKIKIIRCGVNIKDFSPRINRKLHAVPKIGAVGRLVEKKGMDVLIKAVAQIKQQGQRVELHIAGSGPMEQTLKQLAEMNGLDAKDIYFWGAMQHSEVEKFIKSLDVFVLPCKQDANGDIDGIPVVLMEAMLSAVPVISTRISGVPELVIDNVTGLLAEPDDEKSLLEKITLMLREEGLRNNMVDKAIDKVKTDFSLQLNTEKLQHLFCNVIENSSKT